MEISVKYGGNIKLFIHGKKEETIELLEESTVRQLLDKLVEKYGEGFRHHCIEKEWGRIRNSVYLTVDGELISWFPEKDQMKLKGKKEVRLFTLPDCYLVA